MANFNKVILAGNLTRDPEVRYSQSGTAVAKFGMAINRKFKDQESTCFVDITAFGKQAEVLEQYVKKGSPLMVEGRLEFSQWEDKNGGGKRSKLEVVVEQFQFLGGGDKRESGSGGRGKAAAATGGGSADAYDDIPF